MNEQVRIGDADTGFTADDFARLIDEGALDGVRAELVDGRIERMAPAHGEHSSYNARLVIALAGAFDERMAIGTDLAIAIDDRTTRAADVVVGRRAFPRHAAAAGTDLLLVVEIADSTLDRDLSAKSSDYARAGVETYWVVDLFARVTHVMTGAGGNGYGERRVVRFGEPLEVPGSGRTIVID